MTRVARLLLGTLVVVAEPAASRAEVDLWPLLEISEESTTVLYPFFVRDRQTAEIMRIEPDEIEIELGRRRRERTREVFRPGEEFAGRSFEELVATGVGPLDVPDFLMVFPWYYRTHYGRDHHLLWPLFKASAGDIGRIAPFWFSGQNSYTLLPLIHRTEDYTIWSLPPSYFARDGTARAILPFYAGGEHRMFVLPTYYRSRVPGSPMIDTLLPFFHYRRDDQESLFSVLFLFGRRTSPNDAATWILPLYYQGESGGTKRTWFFPYLRSTSQDSDTTAIFPVYFRQKMPWITRTWLLPYYRSKAKDELTTVVFPLYYGQRGKDESITLLLPLYYAQRGPDRRRTWVILYYGQEEAEVSRTWVLPLWLSTQKRPQHLDETTSWHSVLWPLYEREETRASDGTLVKRNRRFLLFSDQLDRDGTRSFKILGIPIFERL